MLSRFRSIVWKFPLLMFALVMATAALFLSAAYTRFSATLNETAEQRLSSAGALVANLLADGTTAFRRDAGRRASNPAIAGFLQTGEGSAAAALALSDTQPAARDSSDLGILLLGPRAERKLAVRIRRPMLWPAWAEERISAGAVPPGKLTVSPIFAMSGVAVLQTVMPVSGTGSGSVAGYIVDTRMINGRGGDAVRELIGGGTTMLVGQPGAGQWTDLSTIVPGPPARFQPGKPVQFDNSPTGAGVGVAVPIRGMPWVVWLQQPESIVQAPLRKVVLKIIPSAAVIAVIGALLVWLLSRGVTRRIVAMSDQIDHFYPDETSEYPVAGTVRDEIDWLQLSLNRMASRLEHQRKLEAQLHQSQKLEAVGRLAGGLAHDFNNIITVIRNYSELVREELPQDGDLVRDIDEIINASVRASDLTSQLLAFSRHRVVEEQVLDVNHIISGAEKMLRRLVPSNIELVTDLHADAGEILADPGQIEQVLLNLTINAADAMPTGGRITIRTGSAELDDASPEEAELAASRKYLCLTVADTGTGMDAPTASQIFEPFFTTKERGRGTGLGLATVHGIVTAAGGKVWVYSEPGRGTRFKLYFPCADGSGSVTRDMRFDTESVEQHRGQEMILLVEDDVATRQVTKRLLEKRGYVVVEAVDGVAALELVSNAGRKPDLVLTDLMMPRMGGAELARRLAKLAPGIAVVLMSGYSEHDIPTRELDGVAARFVEKPYTSGALLRTIREALEPSATSGGVTQG